MRYLIMAPAVVVMILAFTSQMLSIAETTQSKTIRYVDDMNSALDCAYKGVDLNVCSPGIYDYDFAPEMNSTRAAAESFMNAPEILYTEETLDGDIIVVIDQEV